VRRSRILLIGPYPPPEHGTSIPFRLFCDFMTAHAGPSAEVEIIGTQTGDKAVTGYFRPRVIAAVLAVVLRILTRGLRSDYIVIFGSQRFATIIASVFGPCWRLVGKHVAIRFFGGAYDTYFRGLPAPLRALTRILLGTCSRIVVETELVHAALARTWPDRIAAVPNYREPIGRGDDSERRGDTTTFLYTGVVRRGKGIGELLAAFERLRDRRERAGLGRVRLDICGPIYDPEIAGVDLHATAALADRNINVRGNVSTEEVQQAMHSADIFVFPSYWDTEGHSGSLLEAMGAGLPIVAARWRATPELIRDHDNGLLCEPRDAASLEAAMRELLQDPALRLALGRNALRDAGSYRPAVVCADLARALGLGDFVTDGATP